MFLERKNSHKRQYYYYYSKKSPFSLYMQLNALGTRQQLHSKVPAEILSTRAEGRILILPDLCAFSHRHSLLMLNNRD